jgi:hypothetical protein
MDAQMTNGSRSPIIFPISMLRIKITAFQQGRIRGNCQTHWGMALFQCLDSGYLYHQAGLVNTVSFDRYEVRDSPEMVNNHAVAIIESLTISAKLPCQKV